MKDKETLTKELTEIRKVIAERVDDLVMIHNWENNEIKSSIVDLLHQKSNIFKDITKLNEKE